MANLVTKVPAYGINAIQFAWMEIGRGETHGNNSGPDLDRYRRGGSKGPWCAAFVKYCLERAFDEVQKPLPFARTHGAKRLVNNIIRAGTEIHPEACQAGDVICWHRGANARDWRGHIGFVWDRQGSALWALEGNVGNFPSKVGLYTHSVHESKIYRVGRL